MNDWAQLPVRSLAYMGDAVYEIHVRERQLRQGGKVQSLHQATVAHVSAAGQAAMVQRLLPGAKIAGADAADALAVAITHAHHLASARRIAC